MAPKMIEPSTPRATISEDGGGLRITIPARRHWFLIIFLAAWLCGWLVGEISVPIRLFDPELGWREKLFTAAWTLMWTVGGCLFIYVWLWNISGREVVLIDGVSLTIRRHTRVFTRSQSFDLTEVRDLRAAPVATSFGWGLQSAGDFWGLSGGHIVFDYGAKTYRFGGGVDEAEARQLVSVIKDRYPTLSDGQGS
jgi:hypothetical protein